MLVVLAAVSGVSVVVWEGLVVAEVAVVPFEFVVQEEEEEFEALQVSAYICFHSHT